MILTFLRRTLVAEVARTKVRPRIEDEGDHAFRSDAKAEGEDSCARRVGHAAIPQTEASAGGSR